MKALEYLYAMKNANEQMGQEPININEAIAELEALQSRKCDNCTHYARGLGCDLTYWEDYYSGYGFESNEDDFCSRWEAKK